MFKNSAILKGSSILMFFLVFIGSLTLLACSGGGDSSEKTDDTAKKTEPRVVEIVGLDNLKFSVIEITAKPGEEITVNLANNSTLPPEVMAHNFVLLKQGVDPFAFNDAVLEVSNKGEIPENMTDQVLADSGLVAGGETKSVTFKVPSSPGEYTYICTFPGHLAAGMKGTLIVR